MSDNCFLYHWTLVHTHTHAYTHTHTHTHTQTHTETHTHTLKGTAFRVKFYKYRCIAIHSYGDIYATNNVPLCVFMKCNN